MSKALFDLSETLRHSEDISSKLDSMEKEYKNNYEVYQQKFNNKISSVYNAIRTTSDNLNILKEKIDNFNLTKDKNIKILEDFNYLINDYKTVKLICLAHQRFLKIKSFMENLKNDDEDLIDDDIEKYHENIYQKEEFCFELEQFNVDLAGDDMLKIEEIIKNIKKQSLDFTLFILDIVRDFKSNYNVFDKISNIVHKEEERDELTLKAKEGEKGKNPILSQISKMYLRYVTREPKNLKQQIINVIKSGIKEQFLIEKDIFIVQLDNILSDLDIIYHNVHFSFFTFTDFLETYHICLKTAIDNNLDKMDASELLKLIEFKSNYYLTIESKYNKIAEGLGPKLLDNENELLEKYAKTVSNKLHDWIENITKIEIDKFLSRDSDLNKDEYDKLISTGFISLLQMIKIQLEPISFNKKVFLYITKTVQNYCEIFKERICNEIEKDFLPSCQGKSKPGFEDYCIVFGNSGLKLTQYITSLPQCQSDEVRELSNIFISILKTCNNFLAQFVINTCKPATDKLFTNKWDEGLSIFIITIEDFLQDYQIVMMDFTFLTFCHELSQLIVKIYYQKLSLKTTIIDKNTSINIKRDYEKLINSLGKFCNQSDLEEFLLPLNKLVPIIEYNSEDIFLLELKSLLMVKKDISKKLIMNIINKKIDLNNNDKKQFIKKIEEIFNNKILN